MPGPAAPGTDFLVLARPVNRLAGLHRLLRHGINLLEAGGDDGQYRVDVPIPLRIMWLSSVCTVHRLWAKPMREPSRRSFERERASIVEPCGHRARQGPSHAAIAARLTAPAVAHQSPIHSRSVYESPGCNSIPNRSASGRSRIGDCLSSHCIVPGTRPGLKNSA